MLAMQVNKLLGMRITSTARGQSRTAGLMNSIPAPVRIIEPSLTGSGYDDGRPTIDRNPKE
jgi:hypothetical protein